MTIETFLTAFLLVDCFIIGVLTTLAVQHARAHFRPTVHPEEDKPHPAPQPFHLPNTVKERLLEKSKTNFEAMLDRSAVELQHDLKSTTIQLNDQLQKLGREVFSHELERYRLELDNLRRRAESVIGGAQSQIGEHQTELRAKLAEEIAAEKQFLMQQMDAKLADAVASFLIETLGHDVDLGAQAKYLKAMLEEHKADFMREISE